MSRRTIAILSAVVAVGTLGACKPEYSRLSIRKQLGSEGSAADSSGIELREGEVLVFEAKPRAAGRRQYNGLEQLELYSRNPNVALVRPSIAADSWVVNGLHAGTTELMVEIDGLQHEALTIEVNR